MTDMGTSEGSPFIPNPHLEQRRSHGDEEASSSSTLSVMQLASGNPGGGGGGGVADGEEAEELDIRTTQVHMEAVYVDIPVKQLQIIMHSALRAYNKFVFVPTRTTWRKDEGSRRELERDVERTAVSRIAEEIKNNITEKFGGCWHVIYGHDFATYVTHKRLCFCHFQIEGSNVVVWRHGG